MTFRTIHSQRVESLRDSLFATLAQQPLADPLAPEYVLVDNQVLGDWVNLQLALSAGIAANMRYIRPHQLFWELARALEPQLPYETPLSKEEMVWKLFSLLDDAVLLAQPAMVPVRHYLAGNTGGNDCCERKRYQLAASVADLFDQYLVYRPDWLLAWERNGRHPVGNDVNAVWQCELWRVLLQHSATESLPGLQHRATIERHVLEQLREGNREAAFRRMRITRLSVFGITTMSPGMLDMLVQLGEHIDVTLYVLNPCREYWSLIASARQLARKSGTHDAGQYYEIGNPLLASQGVQVRDFIALLQDRVEQYEEHFLVPEKPATLKPATLLQETLLQGTLLQAIQQEILDLTYKGESAGVDFVMRCEQQLLPAADGNTQDIVPSVHVHSCHSVLREVEVLHDQLRDILHRHPDIQPRDIVVMMPRVATYAGCIHAVFNSVPEKYRIDYQITDRTQVEESPLLNSVTTLLHVPDSRLPLSEVAGLLEVPAVQRRFGLDQPACELLKSWLVKAGVRWGLDASHRASLGLPAYAAASWQSGFDRLLSGYAMQVSDDVEAALFVADDGEEILPLDEVEGGNAAILDAMLLFWKTLCHYRSVLQKTATASQWAITLQALLADFLSPEEDDEFAALQVLHDAIAQLAVAEEKQWFTGEIGLPVVRERMQATLAQPANRGHAWREGVKFCSLMPMRGVPFKVIYILGMNMDDYPRHIERRSFDLMRRDYRAGDRAVRIDDRWLFLEALLSARRFFHVSYIGRDMHRNEKREPSVVLSELIDYCRQGYVLPENYLLTEHPLQPFAADYFTQARPGLSPRLVSFDSAAHTVAATKCQQHAGVTRLPSRWQEASLPDADVIEVDLDTFVMFFSRPWDWFLGRKHQAWLNISDDGVEDDENFSASGGLQTWQWRDALIKQASHDGGEADVAARDVLVTKFVRQQRASGAWPLGESGSRAALALQESLRPSYLYASQGTCTVPVCVDVVAGKKTLLIRGQVSGVKDGVYVFHSASKKKPANLLDFHIRFAVLRATGHHDELAASGIFYEDKHEENIAAADVSTDSCKALLAVLAQCFLSWQQSGLPFDPVLSEALFAVSDQDACEAQREELVAELVEEAWYGSSKWKAGIELDVLRRTYYGNINALKDPAFFAVSKEVCSAFSVWLSCRDERAAASKEEKTAKKEKKDNKKGGKA